MEFDCIIHNIRYQQESLTYSAVQYMHNIFDNAVVFSYGNGQQQSTGDSTLMNYTGMNKLYTFNNVRCIVFAWPYVFAETVFTTFNWLELSAEQKKRWTVFVSFRVSERKQWANKVTPVSFSFGFKQKLRSHRIGWVLADRVTEQLANSEDFSLWCAKSMYFN